MRHRLVLRIATNLTATAILLLPFLTAAADTDRESTEREIPLRIHAGQYDRLDVPVSVLTDAAEAQSVYVKFPDGTLGRSQLTEPGMLDASFRGSGKKELHFAVPKLAKGETLDVIALVSSQPPEGRGYVWSGEPRQSRRLSCVQCHQGVSFPTASRLRTEREMLEKTGEVPPFELPRVRPTMKGRDFRWHEQLGQYVTSACWECHGRHMVQYEFGQSLSQDHPGAPDPPRDAHTGSYPAVRSVYHSVFRMKGDRIFAHNPHIVNDSMNAALPCGIHYGFRQATSGEGVHADMVQQHVATLSEEAGKFIGRHCVSLKWVGDKGEIAREERQLTVKNTRARNGSLAHWIDFVSVVSPLSGSLRVEDSLAGFRFVASIDPGTSAEFQQSVAWQSLTFDFEGTTYTTVCFNQPTNPQPLQTERFDPAFGIGYGFAAEFNAQSPLLVHYRLWIQEGEMPLEEIQSMSRDFQQPIEIE